VAATECKRRGDPRIGMTAKLWKHVGASPPTSTPRNVRAAHMSNLCTATTGSFISETASSRRSVSNATTLASRTAKNFETSRKRIEPRCRECRGSSDLNLSR
jgi:hypothetical protein